MNQFRVNKIDLNIEQTSSWVAAIALCMALLGISTASILIVIAEQEMSPNTTIFNRLGIAAIAFGLWNGFKRVLHLRSNVESESQASYTKRDFGLLLIAGVSFAASQILWAESLTQTSVANSTLLKNMMPIFTTLGAWLLFGHRFNAQFLLGMAVAMGGAIAISIEDLQIAAHNMAGDMTAMLAAMLAATTILCLEQLRVKFSTPIVMLWICLIGSAFIFPFALLSESQLFPNSLMGWSAVISLAIVCQVMGQGLLTYSLKRFSSGVVAVTMLAIPVLAAILAMIVFSEKLSFFNWLAFLVVLAGIYLAVSAQNVEKQSLLKNQ